MRKHLLAILLPILVVIIAFIAFKSTKYSSALKNENLKCQLNSKEQCLLENRKKNFSQNWQMDTWRKTRFFLF